MAEKYEWERRQVPLAAEPGSERNTVAEKYEWGRGHVPFGTESGGERDLVAETCEWGRRQIPFDTESDGERDIAVAHGSHPTLVHTMPACARGRCVVHYGSAAPVHGVD